MILSVQIEAASRLALLLAMNKIYTSIKRGEENLSLDYTLNNKGVVGSYTIDLQEDERCPRQLPLNGPPG